MGIAFACIMTIAAQAKDPAPFLGMQIQGVSSEIAKALGLKSTKGVLVRDVAYPGPASRSDIQRGDVLVNLDGEEVTSVESVTKQVINFKNGSKVKATVIRRGKKVDLSLPVGSLPPLWDIKRNDVATIAPLGITFAALTDKVQERFDVAWGTRGVVVSLVDEEKSAGLDIKVGDVIIQINQAPVWKPGHIIGFMKRAQEEKREMVLLLLERDNGFRFTFLPVPQ
ncbi:MAG: PDZ domain-containing protein [Methylocystaceae bacterium]|nr:PDZ domain-containing protein [Methylocystaceae bacterium]